ncbi:MAG: hypothetical protein ACTHQE_05215 [Thermomicrobiales bacterium]
MGGQGLRRAGIRLAAVAVMALLMGLMGSGAVMAEPVPSPTVAPPMELPTLPPVAPTESATDVPTEAPTEPPVATSTPTGAVLPTGTAGPTVTVTATPDGLGGVVFMLTTADGGNVPGSTRVCVEDTCQVVGDIQFGGGSPSVPVGFGGLEPGDYNVWITHTAPYEERAGGIRIVANEVETIDVVLEVAARTPTLTVTGAVETVTPVSLSTRTPAPIAALPNTGVGGGSSLATVLLMLGAAFVLAMAGVAWQARRLS